MSVVAEKDDPAGKISLENARRRLQSAGQLFVELFRTEDCSVELYAPVGEDKQKPHSQDELYVISRGHGKFRRGEELIPFVTGDVLFVPARMEHRFEEFSDDFETWVIFVGPKR
jgi:mannose-6-phosphate isomerase-like protein (cupin superfamily)